MSLWQSKEGIRIPEAGVTTSVSHCAYGPGPGTQTLVLSRAASTPNCCAFRGLPLSLHLVHTAPLHYSVPIETRQAKEAPAK